MPNDHYVPKFYLKKFEIPSKPGNIFVYDRKGRIFRRGIKSVACSEDYYSLKTKIPSAAPRMIDELYQSSESNAGPLFKKLFIASEFNLLAEEQEELAIFIALLACRNPFFKTLSINLHAAFNTHLFKALAENENAWNSQFRDSDIPSEQIAKTREIVLSEDFDKKIEFVAKGDESHDFYNVSAIKQALLLSDVINQKYWVLLNVTSQRELITSDNPVVLIKPDNPVRGMGFGNSDVYLPISPYKALYLVNRQPHLKGIDIKCEGVAELNYHTIHGAHDHLYASGSFQDISEDFAQTKPGQNTKVKVS